ncbi:response regulator [Salidesulfovibrio onnuriiensis]|uniref:response regulator n=1 Tax=Salidesulfovibrio onnuriiensis TaxID=2583823 RepID=UPI0011C802B2|nr:response regulator [Salidesulfovibrio onnuriiensis]
MDIRLLLIDDEEDFARAVARRLAKRGVRVDLAFGGEEGLARLDESPADVVVLDMKMPGMSGLEALRTVRERHPLVEVVLLTGHASMESAREGMRLGAFDYLLKPCEFDTLLGKIREAAERKREQEDKIREARSRREGTERESA